MNKKSSKFKSKVKSSKSKPKPLQQRQQLEKLLALRLCNIDKRLKVIEADRERYYHYHKDCNGYWSGYYSRLREQLDKETGMTQLERDLALLEGEI
jgi:hypothetical protein